MEYTHILIRYGEIFLKGKNRKFFEKKLRQNIKKIAGVSVKELRSRMVVAYFEDHHKLTQVFGLTSYSLAIKCDKSPEAIKTAVVKALKDKIGTFRVATKRSDKTFPIKSPQFNIDVGMYIEEKTNLEFTREDQDITVNIEINQDGAFIYVTRVHCYGGLPTGVEGRVLTFIENDKSFLSAVSFMKRGVNIFPVAFEQKDLSFLQKFSPVPLNLKIVKSFKEMERFASESNTDLMVSGQNFEHLKKYDTDLLVMRPLIAFNEIEIKEKLSDFNFQ